MRWLDGITDTMEMSLNTYCSRRWWWTGKPGMLQSMRLQRVRHHERLNWTECNLTWNFLSKTDYLFIYLCSLYNYFFIFFNCVFISIDSFLLGCLFFLYWLSETLCIEKSRLFSETWTANFSVFAHFFIYHFVFRCTFFFLCLTPLCKNVGNAFFLCWTCFFLFMSPEFWLIEMFFPVQVNNRKLHSY